MFLRGLPGNHLPVEVGDRMEPVLLTAPLPGGEAPVWLGRGEGDLRELQEKLGVDPMDGVLAALFEMIVGDFSIF